MPCLKDAPLQTSLSPCPVYKRDLAVIVNALWKMHAAAKFIKTKSGESGRQGVKSLQVLGSDRNSSSAVLGCSSWSRLLFFGCCFPSTGQSPPQVMDMGQGAHPGHYCTGSFFTCEGEAIDSGCYPLPRQSRWLLCKLLLWHQKVTFCEVFNLIHTMNFWLLVYQVLIMCPNVQSSCLSPFSAQIIVLQHHAWDKLIFCDIYHYYKKIYIWIAMLFMIWCKQACIVPIQGLNHWSRN